MYKALLARKRWTIVYAIVGIVLVTLGVLVGPMAVRGPAVLGASTAGTSQYVAPGAAIEVEFDQWVTLDSLREAVRFEPAVEFNLEKSGKLVRITPASPFAYGTDYRLIIAPRVRNLLGREGGAEFALNFKTAPQLRVVGFTPALKAERVALNTPLTVEFSSPVVDPAQISASAEDAALAETLPQPLLLEPATPGIGRWLSPTTYGFYPEGGLRSASDYTVLVKREITPDGTFLLAEPASWSFTTAAPLLESTRPFDGAVEVPVDGAVEVRLAADVDASSAGAKFALFKSGSQSQVAGAVETSDKGFRFVPSSPLERDTTYEARLLPGVTSRAGAALNQAPLVWSFTSMGELKVIQVEPAVDLTSVMTSASRISVVFNHPVVALTTLEAQKDLPHPLTISPALPGAGRWLATNTYVYEPSSPLAPATSYRVSVGAGLADQTGGRLLRDYSWSFQTIMPEVIASNSTYLGGGYAHPSEPFEIIFNQPMDQQSLRAALKVMLGSQQVEGTISVAGNSARFTPAKPLVRGQDYRLSISTAARAAQGNAQLVKAFEESFTVAPLPVLSNSHPKDGARNADPNYYVELTFNVPMDWESLKKQITIEPKPKEEWSSYEYDNQISLYFDLRAETDYHITVGAEARDIYGTPLGQPASISFRTAPLPPALSVVGHRFIGTYNPYASTLVPIAYTNIGALTYRLNAIDPNELASLINTNGYWSEFNPTLGALVKEGTLELSAARNQPSNALIELGQLTPGTYSLSVSSRGSYVTSQIMVVSPYALTMKRNAQELFLWAVDLATGEPVKDMPLKALTQSSSQSRLFADLGSTNAEGILRAPFKLDEEYYYNPVIVWGQGEQPGQFIFGLSNWSDGISAWDFGLSSDLSQRKYAGNLTTDRPIYRPDQSVFLRGVTRKIDGDSYALPAAGLEVQLVVRDPQSNELFSRTLPIGEFGTFNTSLKLERSAPTGQYSVEATIINPAGGTRTWSVAYGSFSVAEYRKPAFEVSVTPAKEQLVQGDTLEATVKASYFSGGAVTGAPLTWRLMYEPYHFSSEVASNYYFEQLEDPYAFYRWFGHDGGGGSGPELLSEGSGSTDAQGNFSLRLPAELGDDQGSRRLILDVEVRDVDGQVIAAQGRANVHAGAYYIGLRPEQYVVEVGQPQTVSLITLNPLDQPVPGQQLKTSIYRREWYSVREEGSDGRFYWTSSFTDTLVTTGEASSGANGRGSFSFTLQQGGSYRINVEGRDAAGRAVKSNVFTWVYGGDVFWGMNDTNRIELIADKHSYKPGETASILVPAPYKGMRALLTIERGSVLEHKIFTIQDSSELIKLPITAAHAPNIYVSLVLLKPGDDEAPVPDFKVGLLNLAVSTEQQELNISITPDKEQAGPRDQVTYTIKATDHSGKGVRAELSLALVDKAVLSLADDPNPTLQRSFYEKRPLGLETSHSLVALVDRVALKLQPGSKGGGGGEAGEALVRRNFADTAYWNASFVTGEDGLGTARVTLPDNLTTWRLTARGITRDTRVGQASHDLLATRPLLVRPTLPRFLTVGDQPLLLAVLHNNTAEPIEAAVTLEPGTLKLAGAAEQRVQVPANGQALVRWQAETPLAGETLLRFSVSGGGMQDVIEQRLPVQRYTTPEVVATAGQVRQAPVVETLALPPNLPQATQGLGMGQVELELVPSLAGGIGTGLEYLEHYPYACAEQTVSRFLPNAVSYRLFKQLGLDDSGLRAGLETNLAAGLQRLYVLQNLDGGWNWWKGGESLDYLSAYVVQGLVEVQKAGFSVDSAVLERGIDYLKAALNSASTRLGGASWEVNTRSYILFVLAEAGSPDRGRTIALYDQRHGLGVYGKAYLLMALDTLGAEQSFVRSMIGELMSAAILHPTTAHWEEANRDYDYWTMSSDTRSTGLALQALARTDPENFLIPNAVRHLMTLRDQGHWSTTQETAITLMGLAEYLGASGELEGNYDYRAILDESLLGEGSVSRDNLDDPVTLLIDLADLKQDGSSKLTLLRQSREGDRGRLYYTLRMRYYEQAKNVKPLDEGLAISREYLLVDQQTISPTGQLLTQARLGEVVQVRLTIEVPEYVHYLAVEDMLPAGLEALDTSLKTTSAAVDQASFRGEDDYPYWWYFTNSEIRDNRVALFADYLSPGTYSYTYLARASTAGTFETLPATAYQMYAPEVFGRSAGASFVVTE